MIDFPANSVIVKKVNDSNNFIEDLLDCTDINAVSITGSQTISGQKTFEQPIVAEELTNRTGQSLDINASGTQPINFQLNGINKLSLLSNGELTLKTHTAYSGSELRVITAATQTTGDGLTNLTTFTLDEGAAYWFEVFTIGRASGGTLRIRMEVNRCCVYRETGGTAIMVGVVDNTLSRSLAAGGYDIVVDVSGNDLRVRVDGATGETVNWSTTIFYQKIAGNL